MVSSPQLTNRPARRNSTRSGTVASLLALGLLISVGLYGGSTGSVTEAAVAGGSTTQVKIRGEAGVPNDAEAAVLNITAANPSAPGHITAYPCGESRPTASTLNYQPGISAIANSTIVEIGNNGNVCLYAESRVDIIVDINGWFPANSDLTPRNPNRLLDTRNSGTPSSRSTTQVQVASRAGVPGNAEAAVLNITAANPSAPGHITAYPCGESRPTASTLNYQPGISAIANSTIVEIGNNGNVCLYAESRVDIIVDINGWFPANSDLTPRNPNRLLDTRNSGTPSSRSTTQVQVASRAGVPGNAEAAVLNITAANPSAPGHITAYPCGESRPTASTLNYQPGISAIANSTIVEIGNNGNVCLYAESRVDIIVDINGWFPANSDLTPRNPNRLLDTRTTPGPDTSGAEFVATFDNNTGLDAFDTFVFHREGGNGEWIGDHDRSCGPPDPGRSIVVPNKRAGVSAATEEIYLCRDHLMTSMESVSSYSIVGFAPDQVFNRSESTTISWDVNVTDLGDRQWWEVVVIPAGTSHVVCHPHIVDPCGADLVDEYAPGSAMFGIGPYAEFQVVGDEVNRYGGDNPCGAFSSDPEGCASKAIRRRFTMTDNRNGTITIEYPAAGRSWTERGSFPEQFEVVFKDHNYTPEKDNNPPGFTWHWDNIVVR